MDILTLSIPQNDPLCLYRNKQCSSMFTNPGNCLYGNGVHTVLRYAAWGNVKVISSAFIHDPVCYVPEHKELTGVIDVPVLEIQTAIASALGIKLENQNIRFDLIAAHIDGLLRPVFRSQSTRNSWAFLTDWVDREIFKQWDRG